jgi:uncharacterized zinc-type alcohol dehydrogenase-like protein
MPAMTIHAFAATTPGGPLTPFEYEPGPLDPNDVEIDVEYCGICHSDLSMLDNAWEMTQYPFVPGHEVIGTIVARGDAVTTRAIGERVGLGWTSRSCMSCEHCMAGDHNLCLTAEGVIVGRHGGFADRVRSHAAWAVPLPDGADPATAGPLFCGGITVFNPLIQFGIRPTSRVGVVGIGGLGHMALQFLAAWGCHVTAFSTSPAKEEEARRMGAHAFVNSRDADALAGVANCFDMVLVTVNVELDWDAYVATLRPRGHLHVVGAAPSVSAAVFPLIVGQKTIGGSPLGSPSLTATMLEFAARHGIRPITETYPLERVNDAMEKLRSGSPRYRLVLDARKAR